MLLSVALCCWMSLSLLGFLFILLYVVVFCCVLFYVALCCCLLDLARSCFSLPMLSDVAKCLSRSSYVARYCFFFEFALCWRCCFMFPINCSIWLYVVLCCFMFISVFELAWCRSCILPSVVLFCCVLFYVALCCFLAWCWPRLFYFVRCYCFVFVVWICFMLAMLIYSWYCILSGFSLLYVASYC